MKILKSILFFILFLASIPGASAQVGAPKIKRITDKRGIEIIGNIDTLFTRPADRLYIKVFTRQSAYISLPETHGVAHEVLIAVSEYDTYPETRVFSIGPFIGPKFRKGGTDLKDRYVFTFTEGYEKRRTRKLIVYLDKVILQ